MKGSAYCRCGAAMQLSAPEHVVKRALEIFWEQHTGEECSACDARTAAEVRRKKDELAASKKYCELCGGKTDLLRKTLIDSSYYNACEVCWSEMDESLGC